MLTSFVQNAFIDDDWVTMNEYLERCKNSWWTTQSDEEALKCWNLEQIIDAGEEAKSNDIEGSFGCRDLGRVVKIHE